MKRVFFALGVIMLFAATARAGIQITEWMYDGKDGEFIEFTNMGTTPVDMTGWSFDDHHETPGVVSLSAFGTVTPGQSVILTETAANTFRTDWNLPSTVVIIGGNKTNISRDDEINLYDASSNLVDRLSYGDDVNFPGTIRTKGISGDPSSVSVLGKNNVSGWVLSTNGDSYGSWTSKDGDIGSPGVCNFAVPEPSAIALALVGLAGLVGLRRRWL